MTAEYRTDELQYAIDQREAARAKFNSLKPGKARREAEEDLNFWQSRVAFLQNA